MFLSIFSYSIFAEIFISYIFHLYGIFFFIIIFEGYIISHQGFPGSSAGKESYWNAGDPGLIPRSRRSAGKGIGYPLQYSWASLVALMVKNPPAMWETWVQSLDWEDPLEKGMATHSSILAWRIPRGRGTWWAIIHRVAKRQTWLMTKHSTVSHQATISWPLTAFSIFPDEKQLW